jgi:hypothetical protein
MHRAAAKAGAIDEQVVDPNVLHRSLDQFAPATHLRITETRILGLDDRH